MPAKSIAQRRVMAIAKYHPEKLLSRNRGILNMSKLKISDFAKTKEKGLKKKRHNLKSAIRRKLYAR
jgi:hypothetical protein